MSPRTAKRQETAAVPRPRRPAEEKTETLVEEVHEGEEQRGGVTLPVIHTRLPAPSIGLPDMSSTRGRILWLGGLGAFAAFGAIDWPVAVAIAAGTWVAEQRARERLRQEHEADAKEA